MLLLPQHFHEDHHVTQSGVTGSLEVTDLDDVYLPMTHVCAPSPHVTTATISYDGVTKVI